MAILEGYKKVKRHELTSEGYKALSQWTAAETVELADGTDLETKIAEIEAAEPDVATAEKAGIVKPDGDTITIDEDGTLHGAPASTDIELTKAEYDELVEKGEVLQDVNYFINDAEGGGGTGNIDTATPTFTEAEELSNIESKETISTLFGKIKKALSTLFSFGVIAEDELGDAPESRDADTLGGRISAGDVDELIDKTVKVHFVGSLETDASGNINIGHNGDVILNAWSTISNQWYNIKPWYSYTDSTWFLKVLSVEIGNVSVANTVIDNIYIAYCK